MAINKDGNEVQLTKEQIKKYLKNEAGECPFCGSDRISGGAVSEDGTMDAHRDVYCLDCNGSWTEDFKIVNLT